MKVISCYDWRSSFQLCMFSFVNNYHLIGDIIAVREDGYRFISYIWSFLCIIFCYLRLDSTCPLPNRIGLLIPNLYS
ncbi:hypothetical protein EJD97_003350 [Solanum chilense]|uniref:Uncharacterized protein n=2 Tax=Solanum subgen. Lycopersicon TaxID=49274 RepID=A0A3Q7J7B9_SOLLC|nr:hypothetical protein EJD97_003350 [Solanum chilense]